MNTKPTTTAKIAIAMQRRDGSLARCTGYMSVDDYTTWLEVASWRAGGGPAMRLLREGEDAAHEMPERCGTPEGARAWYLSRVR